MAMNGDDARELQAAAINLASDKPWAADYLLEQAQWWGQAADLMDAGSQIWSCEHGNLYGNAEEANYCGCEGW